MDEKQLKNMELRLERIEKAIDSIAKPVVSQLSEDDITAYHRVREVLWEDGTCGINETSPCVVTCRIIDKVCKVVPIPICKACDVECTCGPCNIWTEFQPNYGGLYRFRALGR